MTNICHLCDCMDFMAGLPDNAFDLAIVDPPYGIGISEHPFKQHFKQKKWDSNIPDRNYFQQLFRVSKYQIIWGGNYFDLEPSQGFIIWDKWQPFDFSSAMCEFAWISEQRPAKIFKYKVTKENNRIHPTQKPVAIYKWILINYAKPGWKILDTHEGSGSNRIACYDLGFYHEGCELDPDYHAAQEERFRAYVAANPRLPGIAEADRQIFEQGEL